MYVGADELTLIAPASKLGAAGDEGKTELIFKSDIVGAVDKTNEVFV